MICELRVRASDKSASTTDRCSPEKELGWQLYEGQEGRGYATEAAMALRDWATRALRLDGLVSYVHPENVASAAVAERLGATLDPNAPKPNPGALVYRYR